MTINVAIAGTETFHNNYSNSKIDNITNFVEYTWKTYIEEGSGDYEANFNPQYTSSVMIQNLHFVTHVTITDGIEQMT